MLMQMELPDDLSEDYHFPEFSVSFEAKVDLPSYLEILETSEEDRILKQLPEEIDDLDWDDYDEFELMFGDTGHIYFCKYKINISLRAKFYWTWK